MAGSLRVPTAGQHVAAHLFGPGNGDGSRLHEFLVKGLVVPLNSRVALHSGPGHFSSFLVEVQGPGTGISPMVAVFGDLSFPFGADVIQHALPATNKTPTGRRTAAHPPVAPSKSMLTPATVLRA